MRSRKQLHLSSIESSQPSAFTDQPTAILCLLPVVFSRFS
jgi:hypothetical protein